MAAITSARVSSQYSYSPLARRYLVSAIKNGLVAGAVIAFFVLIGMPSGASDTDGLPAWFVWGLFILVALIFGFMAARPRSIMERRHQALGASLVRGLLVGLAAAVVTVALMVAINAAQLWELNVPKDTTLPSGLRSNITRVQDVLGNVTSRTTAIMAGLPLRAIQPAPGTPRTDPVGGFILMAALLPIAAVVGGGLSYGVRMIGERREHRAKTGQRAWTSWLPLALPLIIFAFIIFNSVVPTLPGGLGDAYRGLVGGSAQLAGLLASFLLVAAGLIPIRVSGDLFVGSYRLRAGVLLAITLILFAIGWLAPMRNVSDMLFSPRAPNPIQITGPDGSVQVVADSVPPVDPSTLFSYRQALILIVGLLLVGGNLVSARGRTALRRLVAANILLGTLVIAPLYLDKYQQSVLLLVGINVLLGLGLNIVVGYAGLLDLGYVAFFAIGAYVYAFLSSNQDIRNAGQVIGLKYGGNDQIVQALAVAGVVALVVSPIVIALGLAWWRRRAPSAARTSDPRVLQKSPVRTRPAWLGYALVAASIAASLLVIGLLRGTPFYDSFKDFPAFIIGILLGMLVAGISGFLLGIPVLRLRGDYLAIVTLGFGEIIRLFLNNLRTITGGPQGVVTIPHPNIGNVEIGSNEGLLYLVLAGCILVAFMSMRLKSSRLGRAWGAMRSDEDIAQSMGVNLVNAKVLAFAIGAAFAGIGGVIFAARQANIFPDNFTLQVSINVLSLIVIGGMGSIPGVIVGALVLIGLPESLRVFESYRVMAFGALLVAMMVLRPMGLLPESSEPLERRARMLAGKEPIAEEPPGEVMPEPVRGR